MWLEYTTKYIVQSDKILAKFYKDLYLNQNEDNNHIQSSEEDHILKNGNK